MAIGFKTERFPPRPNLSPIVDCPGSDADDDPTPVSLPVPVWLAGYRDVYPEIIVILPWEDRDS